MKHYYDVIVVGGGPAGIMAAMASAKLGASTLLIEKNGFLGGAATAACLGPISPSTIRMSRSSTVCPSSLWTGW